MKLLAVDVETEMIPPAGTDKINLRNPVPRIVCASWASDQGCGVAETSTELADVLARHEEYHAVFHNAAFDLAVLEQWGSAVYAPLRRRLLHRKILDTVVLYYLRDPDPPLRRASLGHLAHLLLGRQLDKGSVRTSFVPGQRLTEDQRRYAAADAQATLDVAQALLRQPPGAFRSAHIRGGVFRPPAQHIVACQAWGTPRDADLRFSAAAAWLHRRLPFHIDAANLVTHHEALSARCAELGTELAEAGLARIVRKPGATPRPALVAPHVPRSWTAVSAHPPVMHRRWKGAGQRIEGVLRVNQKDLRARFEAAAEDLSITPRLSAKTKQISLARDDWKDHYNALPPELRLYLDYERAKKYVSAFTKPLVDARAAKVFPSFYIPGAATGRWASRRPNIQQVPKKLRDIYRASPGHLLAAADYPTLELYCLDQVMFDLGIRGPLHEALAHEDVHRATAALMFGVSPERVTAEQRQAAKACNFGLPGGMGARRFADIGRAQGLGWGVDDAAEIRRLWFQAYPDVQQYLQAFRFDIYRMKPDHVEVVDWLQRLGFDPAEKYPSRFEIQRALNDGRHYTCALPSGRVIPDRRFSEAANCMFQGLGADVITEAFVLACARGLPVVAVVHDSLVLDSPLSRAEQDAEELVEIMAIALHRVCPVAPDVTGRIEYTLGEEWS